MSSHSARKLLWRSAGNLTTSTGRPHGRTDGSTDGTLRHWEQRKQPSASDRCRQIAAQLDYSNCCCCYSWLASEHRRARTANAPLSYCILVTPSSAVSRNHVWQLIAVFAQPITVIRFFPPAMSIMASSHPWQKQAYSSYSAMQRCCRLCGVRYQFRIIGTRCINQ